MRDHGLRLPSVFSALLLFGAAGLLAMVIAFSAGGGLQRPLSSPVHPPAVAAPPAAQTTTPTPSTSTPTPATPTPTATPACASTGVLAQLWDKVAAIFVRSDKHHKNKPQACATPTAPPAAGGGNGD